MKLSNILLMLAVLVPTGASAYFEPTGIPAPKTNPPRVIGEKIKLNAAAPKYDLGVGKQRISCRYQLMAKIDPIVSFGQTSGHYHSFAGNPTISTTSTLATLQANTAGGSCTGGSAYGSSFWAPVMVDTANNNQVLGESMFLLYYESSFLNTTVKPIPQGLKMVVGKMDNTDPSKNLSEWSCSTTTAPFTTTVYTKSYIPVCVVGEKLREQAFSKECLKLKPNGQPYLDTDTTNFPVNDHASHMTDVRTGNWQSKPILDGCPTGYMRLPAIRFIRDFVVKTGTSATWRLTTDSSDMSNPGGTAHWDYFMAIPSKWSNMFISNCINASKVCDIGLLGKDPADGIYKAFTE
jgi:hypothetical protein